MFKNTFCTEHLRVTASVLTTSQLERLRCEKLYEELVRYQNIHAQHDIRKLSYTGKHSNDF